MITAGVGLHDAGMSGEALAFKKTSVHAGPYHRFKDSAQEVTVAETAVAIHRECRVIRHRVVKIEPTEPPIRHVHFDFLAQPPLEADAVAIPDDQHSDHKLGINRRPANVAIEGCELLPKLNQYPRHDRIDPPQQIARRDAPFEVEQVKQLALIARLSTHHGKPPPLNAASRRNHCSPKITSLFSTLSTRSRHKRECLAAMHAAPQLQDVLDLGLVRGAT